MDNKHWDNLYFGGKVRSSNTSIDGIRATEGEIDPGEYVFSTASEEYMTVVSGVLAVKLSGEEAFKDYSAGQTFIVPANFSFTVKAQKLVSYICKYMDGK